MEYEINESKSILDYKKNLNYDLMMKYIDVFCRRYPFIGVTNLGHSIMGREIPMITLGKGKPCFLYVGAHGAGEWLTSIILLRFVNEYCELYKNKSRIYNSTLEYLYMNKTVYVVPMLNPDGVDYRINGVTDENILYDRLFRMNGESSDFSAWQANGRGVELKLNYNCDFTERKKIEAEKEIYDGSPSGYGGTAPESEPETGALCNFLRFNDSIKGVLSLYRGKDEIRYSNGDRITKRSHPIAKSMSRMSGYDLVVGEKCEQIGNLLGWCISELDVPTFEVSFAEEKMNFNQDLLFKSYADMREVLFAFPLML